MAFLQQINKLAEIRPIKNMDDLELGQLYPITLFTMMNTKVGQSIIADLEDRSKNKFRVFLPRRIGSKFTQKDMDAYNNGDHGKLSLIYNGKLGQCFLIEFVQTIE